MGPGPGGEGWRAGPACLSSRPTGQAEHVLRPGPRGRSVAGPGQVLGECSSPSFLQTHEQELVAKSRFFEGTLGFPRSPSSLKSWKHSQRRREQSLRRSLRLVVP